LVGDSARWSIHMGILPPHRKKWQRKLLQLTASSLRFWKAILRPRPHPTIMELYLYSRRKGNRIRWVKRPRQCGQRCHDFVQDGDLVLDDGGFCNKTFMPR
ncbi:hypothetical protein KI387_006855, partial [Taxus chinensis]